MPCKFEKEKLKIPNHLDRRIKLTPQQRGELFRDRLDLGMSYSALAKKYGCSKRLAIFICLPETLEANKKLREERGGSKQYYNKEKNTEFAQKTRKYKSELLEKGLLIKGNK